MATSKSNTSTNGRVKRPFVWAMTGQLYQKGQTFEGTPESVESLKKRGYLEGAHSTRSKKVEEPETVEPETPETPDETPEKEETDTGGVTLDDIKPKRRTRRKKVEATE